MRCTQRLPVGLPRTCTNSFCAAVSILLDGPSYHVGVQTALAGNDETTPKNWIRMNLFPATHGPEKEEFMALQRTELDGYVCVADPPASLLVPELLQLYPNAKVLCTTRDKAKWAVSMEAITKLIIPYPLSRTLYFWLPTLRLMPILWYLFPKPFIARHGETMTDIESIYRIYDRHHEWLEGVVLKGKLFYVNVKEGWVPICRALGVGMPDGLEFPRLNDGKDMEELFRGFAVEGLRRGGVVVGFVGVVIPGSVGG